MSDKVEFIYIKENESNDDFKLIMKDEPNYNKDETDILKLKSNYVDFENTIEKLKKICELKVVEIDNFMDEVIPLIKLDENHYGDLKDCYTTSTNIYQIMYKMVSQYDKMNELPKNLLSSLLTYDKQLLNNECILMNTHVSDDGNSDKLENCNFTHLIHLILNVDYHSCVYVDENNNFKQIIINNKYEIVDPFNKFRKNLNLNQLLLDENCEMIQKNYLNFELVFVFKRNENDNINEPASRLLHGLIKGDCIIYSKGEHSFNDLLVEDVIKLLKVWNKFSMLDSDYEKINKKDKTKYHLLNDRLAL